VHRALLGLTVITLACASVSAQAPARPSADARASTIARARVWSATDIPSQNLRTGPQAKDGFAPGAMVVCDYLDKKLSGASPKFACNFGEADEVKVKFGGTNGEVYGEVAASRLLWALGFGADRMYPVKVVCRGCPRAFGGIAKISGEQLFDPAVIERKASGTELTPDGEEGWSWKELDLVDERAGGARKAERDALKLLAVLLQHTDTKPQQQRLVCLEEPTPDGECGRPFMMINDVGLTFGRANQANTNVLSGVNLAEWSRTPVWKNGEGCVGNLPRSFTGTLKDPIISEDGRVFLASLLTQLSDAQLHDLFDVARVTLRPRSPVSGRSGFPAVQEWVDAFKNKRQQIIDRRCA
jgi:hypothetical protein